MVKNLPANAGFIRDESRIPGSGRSPGQEDPLEEEMATHSSIHAWKIPWTEEPGRLQSMRVAKSGTRLSEYTHTQTFTIYRGLHFAVFGVSECFQDTVSLQKRKSPGTSLVFQWLRICLSMQGTQFSLWSGKISRASRQLSL